MGDETENFYVGTYYQETPDGDVFISDTLMHGEKLARPLDMDASLTSLRISKRLASEAEGKRLLERLRRR